MVVGGVRNGICLFIEIVVVTMVMVDGHSGVFDE